MSCCDKCHFDQEEKHALPYLRREEQFRLLEEHRQLKAMDEGPEHAAAIAAHARWEDELFAARLPPSMAAYFIVAHQMLLEYTPERTAQLLELDQTEPAMELPAGFG